MPSKRKKNARRLKRMAQRRLLEEQHASNPLVKASPGLAVSAPPGGTSKKAAKTPAPVQTPVAVPIVVPAVEIPIVEPEPVVEEPVSVPVVEPVPVEVAVPELEAVVLEQTPAEVEVEVPAPVTEESPVVEAPPAESPIVEAAIVQEAEPIIPEPEPEAVTEAIPPAEAPVAAPVEIEIQTEENIIETTETEQTYDVCEPETEVKAEDETAVETEVAITDDIATPEPVTETTEEPEAEAPTCDQVPAEEVVTETVEEVVAEIPEPDQETEAVASLAEDEDDEAEIEVLAEEDVPAPCVEIPVVPDTVPEAPIEEAEALVTEVKESFADTMVDDFVVTESVSAVDVAIAESAAVQPEIVEVSNIELGSMDVMPAEPVAEAVAEAVAEPVAAPAEEMDTSAEQICLEVLSEEPKLQICDMPCQMQLAVESVQLSSMEMPLEVSLNGHIVPEVSIEG